MRLNPRYDERPVIAVETRVNGTHPMIRQRERLETVLRSLTDDEWQRPSRCSEWTVQDVVSHLVSTNAFWTFSIQAGAAGEPTRFLSTFDPVASPAELVKKGRGAPRGKTLEQFATSCAGLANVVDAMGDDGWGALGEAPPGHIPMKLVADHALWDCWIHERDISLPLGRIPVEDGDEVLTCLRYAAGLGRALELSGGSLLDARPVVLEVTEPNARIVVEVDGDAVRVHDGQAPAGAITFTGDAVQTLEMVSMRDAGVTVPDAIRTLNSGLAKVFDQPISV